MWSALSRGSCFVTLLALALVAGAGLVGAATGWSVGRVREIAMLCVFAALGASVSMWILVPSVDRKDERAKHRRAPKEDDLRRMEKELGVTLSSDYRRLMLQFPIRFDRGNSDSRLWND